METAISCVTTEDREVLVEAIKEAVAVEQEFINRLVGARQNLPPGIIHESTWYVNASEKRIKDLERLRKLVANAPMCHDAPFYGVTP